MVHETAFSMPAVVRKSLAATLFERNTMLKTLKRKIALVAVAVLGFGLVSTVPAFAAAVNLAAQNTINIANAAVRTGQTATFTVSGDLPNLPTTDDWAQLTVALATKPNF